MLAILFLQWVIIHICTECAVSQTIIRGLVGQAVTLPCSYSVSQGDGLHDMCWGRGSCPKSKCNKEIVRTNGRRIVTKTSQRYQLRGYVTGGDVSLTITSLSKRDEGLYCCRIEIPGWFNDLKKTLNLQVERATTTVSSTVLPSPTGVITTTRTTALIAATTPSGSLPFFLTTAPVYQTLATTSDNEQVTTSLSVVTDTDFRIRTHTSGSIISPTNILQTDYTGNDCCFYTTETASPETDLYGKRATSSSVTTSSTSSLKTTVTTPIPPRFHPTMNLTSSPVSPAINVQTTGPGFQVPKQNEPTNLPNNGKITIQYEVLVPCAAVLSVLLVAGAILLVKGKQRRKYRLNKMKRMSKYSGRNNQCLDEAIGNRIKEEEDHEQISIGLGDNEIFPI